MQPLLRFANALRTTTSTLAVLALLSCVGGCGAVKETAATVDGAEGYLYGFPLVMMDVTRDVMTATSKSGEYKAPINQFGRIRTFVSPDFKDCVRISVNSLWSYAFLDLDKEPVVITMPEIRDRYVVLQALNWWTDDFASVGTRTNGGAAGNYLIAGPNWHGQPPADINQTFQSTTRFASVLVQIAAASSADFPVVAKLQDQIRVIPLSSWGRPFTPPDNVPVNPDVDITATPVDQVGAMDGPTFFKRLSVALNQNNAYPADKPMLEKLKRLGIEPGKEFDPAKLDPAVAKGMTKGAQLVWNGLQTAQDDMKGANGWLTCYDFGNFGTDYKTRAFLAYFGLGALTKVDALYPTAFVDADGKTLDGRSNYVMHFDKGALPPSLCDIWSISPYRGNFYVRNSLNRYGILSNMPLKFNPDGSLDVFVQRFSPGPDKEANWLPIPPSGPFNVTVRIYQPAESCLNGTYKLPPLTKVN